MASWGNHNTQEAYRIYIAEAMRCISESVSKFSGGPFIVKKWADITNPKPEDTRSPGEVIDHMKERLKEVSMG